MAGVKGKSGKAPGSLNNLVPINENVTREEKVEAGRKGGIASGEARRQRKEMRDIILDVFELGIKRGKVNDEFDSLEDTKGQNITVAQALILAQIKKAMNGDTRALEFLRDTAGMKPADQHEITAKVGTSTLQGILDQLDEKDDKKEENQED